MLLGIQGLAIAALLYFSAPKAAAGAAARAAASTITTARQRCQWRVFSIIVVVIGTLGVGLQTRQSRIGQIGRGTRGAISYVHFAFRVLRPAPEPCASSHMQVVLRELMVFSTFLLS
jgi:hypothetical protein